MILTNLPITISASGATTTLASTSPANILVKDSSTGQTITTTYTDGSAGTSTITFANNYTIAAGQTGKTFDIYANVSSIAGQSGTGRVNLGLGSSSLFSWKDVNGNTVLDGSKILNYPNTTVSLVN
jgi:hypothetical protein